MLQLVPLAALSSTAAATTATSTLRRSSETLNESQDGSGERSHAASPPPRPSSRQLSDVLSELAEELKCSICLDHFQTPVFLPCHHTFCAACVDSLIRSDAAGDSHATSSSSSSSSSTASASVAVVSLHRSEGVERGGGGGALGQGVVICPICRAECGVPENKRGKFKKCGRCRRGAASVYCFACTVFLCDKCDEEEPQHADAVSSPTSSNDSQPTITTTSDNAPLARSATMLRVPSRLSSQALHALDAENVGDNSALSSTLAALRRTVSTSAMPFLPPAASTSSTTTTKTAAAAPASAVSASSDSDIDVHVRVPVLDAVAILQLRRADTELDPGTLGAQSIPASLTRGQCETTLRDWLSRQWLREQPSSVRAPTFKLVFIPHWLWVCETMANGTAVATGSSSTATSAPRPSTSACSLRAWRKPVLVMATSAARHAVTRHLAPWDLSAAVRLNGATPEHSSARMLPTDILQRDAWSEAEARVRQDAAEELDRELRRRLRLDSTEGVSVTSQTDIVIASKTVRRLWLPVWECAYYGQDGEEYLVFINAQTGKLWGERPAVSHTGLLGALSFGLAAVLTPLAAYRFARASAGE